MSRWDIYVTSLMGQKDRMAPRFAHWRVRERGTSGHAAAATTELTGAPGADFWLKGAVRRKPSSASISKKATKHEAFIKPSSAAPHIKKRARRISKNVVGISENVVGVRNPRKENPAAGCKSKEKMSRRFTFSQNVRLQLR